MEERQHDEGQEYTERRGIKLYSDAQLLTQHRGDAGVYTAGAVAATAARGDGPMVHNGQAYSNSGLVYNLCGYQMKRPR